MTDANMDDSAMIAKAEKFKNQGNDQFKLGNYQAAISAYTDAIGKYPRIFFIPPFRNKLITSILHKPCHRLAEARQLLFCYGRLQGGIEK